MEQEMAVLEKEFGDFIGSVKVGNPDTHRNLAVFPLFSEKSYQNGYVVLDEALSTGKFIVEEVSEGGSVPNLKVVNGLDCEVFLLDGSTLVGARQNRIINTSILVGRKHEVVIPVSCVEQGRWRYNSRRFSSSSASHLYASLRKQSSAAVYRNLKTKKAFENDQAAVWNSIREKRARFKTDSETEAMEDIYASQENAIREYESAFRAHPGQVGFVAAIDGKIIGCDLFGSGDVFAKLYRKALKGYVLDAVDADTSPQKKEGSRSSASLGTARVERFLRKTLTAKRESFSSVGEGNELRFEDKGANGFALVRGKNVVHMAVFA